MEWNGEKQERKMSKKKKKKAFINCEVKII